MSEIVSPRQVERRNRRIITTWMMGIFAVIAVAEILAAYVVVYQNRVMMPDALSRTANAYYVLYLTPHKLASVGFVWNPLPSLLQLPIIYFAKYWQPLASHAFAGSILTSLFAGINAALLFRYFKQAGLKTATSLLIVALYAFNPFVFFYGLNGMSETIFFTALIVSTANFALWIDDRKTGRLVAVALSLVGAFLSRYEVFALMLGFGFSMLIVIYWMPDRLSPFTKKPWKMKWHYSVATGTMLFLPVLYAIGMWMFINWSIMGDPLHFLNSSYSNESQSAVALSGNFKEQMRNLGPALSYVLERMFPFLLPFFAITAERIYTRRLIKPDYLILLVQVGAISGFHLVMLMTGNSFGWLRFYCFSLFICLAWMPYELGQLKGRMKQVTIVLLCLSLALSGVMVGVNLTNEDIMKEERMGLTSEDTQLSAQINLAQVINEKYSDSVLLLDSFTLSTFIMNLKNPGHVLTSIADELFDISVADPPQSSADYLVVPSVFVAGTKKRGGVGTLDAINKAHPSLFVRGADWAELVYDNEYLRLYKIIRWEESANEVADFLNGVAGDDGVVLFDTATAGTLTMRMNAIDHAITTLSADFDAAIQDPRAHAVDYVVIATPEVDKANGVDAIAAQYPRFMTDGVPFGELVFENDKYRVFDVTDAAA